MPRNILVVDDEPLVLRVTALVLRYAGYGVLTAASAEHGLKLCAESQDSVSLVISDVSMPGMSGKDLARCLARTGRQIPVILMSGYTIDALAGNQLISRKDLIGFRFLQKPFKPSELLSLVENVIGKPEFTVKSANGA